MSNNNQLQFEFLVKIALAILLFLCLADMPYGYYEFVRIAAMIGFSLLAFWSHEKRNMAAVIIFIGLVLVFQPFAKVALGRTMWNVVDVLVGIGLIVTAFSDRRATN